MEFTVYKHDESKCRAHKIEAGDKLYAFDEEHAESLAQLLITCGCSAKVGCNCESGEWSVYIQSINNDNGCIKTMRNEFGVRVIDA